MCEAELANVNRRYGSNSGPGLNWLLYHNESHSRHVRDTARSLAQELASSGLVDPEDVDLVEIAGAFHDHEQDLGSGPNERASADAAVAAMRGHPEFFTPRDIQRVESMILATTVNIENGSLKQAASKADLLQACLADADLSTLAARDGVASGLRLFCEGEIKAGRMAMPGSRRELQSLIAEPQALTSFLNFNANLLSEHEYLLQTSEARFRSGINRNLQTTTELLHRQMAGASFAELYREAAGLESSAGIGQSLAFVYE